MVKTAWLRLESEFSRVSAALRDLDPSVIRSMAVLFVFTRHSRRFLTDTLRARSAHDSRE